MIFGPKREDSDAVRSLRALMGELGLTEKEIDTFLDRLAAEIRDNGLTDQSIELLCQRFANTLDDVEKRFGARSSLTSKMKFILGSLALGVAGNLLTDLVKAGHAQTYSFNGLSEVLEILGISPIEAARECGVSSPTFERAAGGSPVSRIAGIKISAGIQRLERERNAKVYRSTLFGPDHGTEFISLNPPGAP